jgi:acetoin utilization deacetylase AcuC-like enzyme
LQIIKFVMKVLFNKKSLLHNIDSEAEGAYRLADFKGKYEDVDMNGEPYLELVHTPHYIESIRSACARNEYLAEVLLSPESWDAAMSAVGLTILASERNDFAIVRPPGHHAGREFAHGFCFFNNLAIATQKLVNEGKRVFILDFDGHHGDGTQSIFYESKHVFYCSIHQNFAFPFTGFAQETGKGEGLGYTQNFPLISGSGDKEFLAAFDKAIQLIYKFDPDIVAVSAGFDAYFKDFMLGLEVSLGAFYECGFRLRRAVSDIFAVLEGGYHEDVKLCVDRFIEGIHKGALPPALKWDVEMSIG